MREKDYPRIIQIIPCEHIWIEHKTTEDHWPEKAVALALLEYKEKDTRIIKTTTCYIGLYDVNYSSVEALLLNNYNFIFSIERPVFEEKIKNKKE